VPGEQSAQAKGPVKT